MSCSWIGSSNHRQLNVDVAARRVGIGAALMRAGNNLLGDGLLQSGQIDLELDRERIADRDRSHPDLRGDCWLAGWRDLPGTRHQLHGAQETSRIAGRKELLRIGSLSAGPA